MCALYKIQTHTFKTITVELIFGFFTISGNVSLLSLVNFARKQQGTNLAEFGASFLKYMPKCF